MKTTRLFNAFLLILELPVLVSAQPGWTMYNETNSALYTTPYTGVDIDKTGKIWAGASYDGAGVFNGTTWKRYNSSNSKLKDDYIDDILVDNNNKVWMAGLYGINVFDGTNFVLYDTNNTKPLVGGTPYLLGKDKSGAIWVATRNGSFDYQGMARFDGTTWTTITNLPANMAKSEITDFTVADNGDVWITGNGVAKYSGGVFTYHYSGVALPKGITIDKNGIVWVVGFDGIAKYDGTTWTDFDNTTDLGLPAFTYYTAAVQAVDNYLLIGSAAGLLRFSTISNTVVHKYTTANAPFERNYCVSDITRDANGDFWLATCNGVAKMTSVALGLDDKNAQETNISCYPNPAKGFFNAENRTTLPVEMKVTDLMGNVVHRALVSPGDVLKTETGKLPSGLYNAVFYSSNQVLKSIKISVE